MWTGVTKAPSHSSSLPSIETGFVALGINPRIGFSWAWAAEETTARIKTVKRPEREDVMDGLSERRFRCAARILAPEFSCCNKLCL